MWRCRYFVLADTLAVACGHSRSAEPETEGRSLLSAPLDRVFTLRLGEEVSVVDELRLKFVSVLGDSRCPQGVDCVWEGNAEISVEASKSGESPTLLRLNTHRGSPTEATVLEFTVRLVGLAPSPKIDDQAGAREYAASLLVTAREPAR